MTALAAAAARAVIRLCGQNVVKPLKIKRSQQKTSALRNVRKALYCQHGAVDGT